MNARAFPCPTPCRIAPPARRWEAEWIWDRPPVAEQNVHVLFRREFELPDAPDKGAFCLVSASQRYRLWINGRRVGDGPPFCAQQEAYVDRRELDGFLRPGANVIAALVCCGTAAHHPWRGGFLCEVHNDTGLLLKTDETWTCCRPAAWRPDTQRNVMNAAFAFQEHLDAAALPPDWIRPGFDGAGWSPVYCIGRPPAAGPWWTILPRDIPFPEETALRPAAIACTEECLGLVNRNRPGDLSISLSMAGLPLQHARVENAGALLEGRDGCVLACSDRHLKAWYDGEHDPCIVFDFGRIVTAHVRFECTAPEGACLEFGYAEDLIDGRFNNAVENQLADGYRCRAGRQSYCFLAWRAFRYLKLRLRSCPGGLQLHALEAVRVRYPFEARGAFRSGDATLNGVFEICRETIRLCSIDQLMDTPCREGAQWLGDVSAVTLGGIYACFGDTLLPEKFLRQSAASAQSSGLLSNITHLGCRGFSERTIPDYSLWWIIGLWRHYMYTGREAWIRTYYPEVLRIIRFHLHYLNERGFLCDLPGWVFIDWAPVDKRGCSAVYNALFAGALDAAEQAARLVGDADAAAWMAGLAATLRRNFVAAFYDENRGVFADGRAHGTLSEAVSEHANFAALRWACCPHARGQEILDRFDRGIDATECEPFFMAVVLEALRRYGRGDTALRLIRERWGRRMLDRGATSCFEEWRINGSFRRGQWEGAMRTQSHAWSACPAEFLIRGLSGIEILEPGCAALRVAPVTRT
ncbi:MAG: hypothetical protein JW951_00120, partial [Lentisphaerae bacterium]|nr:hypothetical protein [Lentisphaerota bacterium]